MGQVVIHCLWNSDDLQVQSFLLSKNGNLVACVHAVISAIVEEDSDVILLHALDDSWIILIAKLPAAASDGCCRSMGKLSYS